jgi:hypothetical protein
MKRPLFLSLALLLTFGCTKTDEEKRLIKFRKSIPYKSYRLASEKATELALAEYNKTLTIPLEPAWAHATLGFICLISGKSDYAFIESELARESHSLETTILAQGVQSIALSKLKASHLAHEQFIKLKKNLVLQQERMPVRTDDLDVRLMYLSLLAAGIYHDDAKLANNAAKRLATYPSLDYLPSLVNALLELKTGQTEKAVQQLQTLSQQPHFPDSKRPLLTETLAVLQQEKLPKNERDALVDRLLLQIMDAILDELFSTENQQFVIRKITSFAEEFTKGFSFLYPSTTNTVENVSSPQ